MAGKYPKYVFSFKDRHGKRRFYVRRKGAPLVPMPNPDSPEFEAAYNFAVFGVTVPEEGAEPKPYEQPGPRKRVRYDTEGWVYFLRCGDRVKIGFSTDPFNRAKTLKTGIFGTITSFVMVRGTYADEKRLHREFHKHRIQGEIFSAVAQPVHARMARAAAYGKIETTVGPQLFFSREARQAREDAKADEVAPPPVADDGPKNAIEEARATRTKRDAHCARLVAERKQRLGW